MSCHRSQQKLPPTTLLTGGNVLQRKERSAKKLSVPELPSERTVQVANEAAELPSFLHDFSQISQRRSHPSTFLQTKLAINSPGDKYEKEADQVSAQIMRMPASLSSVSSDKQQQLTSIQEIDQTEKAVIQRQYSETAENDTEEDERLQRKEISGQTHNAAPQLASQLSVSKGQGSHLPQATQAFMESRFGRDFDQVTIHTDSNAAQMNRSLHAKAFTHQQDIFFGEGQFQPGSDAGKHLLAHELTHVVQQSGSESQSTEQPISRAPASIQRDITNVSVSEAYAQSLTDETLLLELEQTERDLALASPNSDEYAALGSNQNILSTEMESRRRAFSAYTSEPNQSLPVESVGEIPEGGESINTGGIITRDQSPNVRLRSSPETQADSNIIRTLPFNTHVQVIKRFPGDWFFVSTPTGDLGYVASAYVKTNLPEPNARLHRVEPGISGTAIAIAEHYFGQYSDDWGQDLRFYINVLAWANGISVPNTTGGWRQVQFQAGNFIWIPSYRFARSLQGAVNSGSISYNFADSVGLASFVERVGELWNDLRKSVSLSRQYLGEAIAKHAEQSLYTALYSLAITLVGAIAILAISTAIGAAIGALAGGVGAAPGAAAGFEIGMVLLEWIGLGLLILWIGQALTEVGSAFGRFLKTVWDARGNEQTLDKGAREFAEAIGILLGKLLEAIILFGAAKGLNHGVGLIRNSKLGKSMGESRSGEWLGERVRRVRAGETPIVGPMRTLARFYRGVEIVDGTGSPLGEFDGVNMSRGRFIENKSASGLRRVNPRTGQPAQTPAQWAAKQIFKKTMTRIKNLGRAAKTRPTSGGSSNVPSLAEIRGIRHVHFVIDGSAPALRSAVFAELASLRTEHPGWIFTAEFGVGVSIPPVPSQNSEDSSSGE